MNMTGDPYQAQCLRCNYTWTKKSKKDPKVCPACNSRKYREPKPEKTRNGAG